MVKQATHNRSTVGSIPTRPTIFYKKGLKMKEQLYSSLTILSCYTHEQIGTFYRYFIEKNEDLLVIDGFSRQWEYDDFKELENNNHIITYTDNANYHNPQFVGFPTKEFLEALKNIKRIQKY